MQSESQTAITVPPIQTADAFYRSVRVIDVPDCSCRVFLCFSLPKRSIHTSMKHAQRLQGKMAGLRRAAIERQQTTKMSAQGARSTWKKACSHQVRRGKGGNRGESEKMPTFLDFCERIGMPAEAMPVFFIRKDAVKLSTSIEYCRHILRLELLSCAEEAATVLSW